VFSIGKGLSPKWQPGRIDLLDTRSNAQMLRDHRNQRANQNRPNQETKGLVLEATTERKRTAKGTKRKGASLCAGSLIFNRR